MQLIRIRLKWNARLVKPANSQFKFKDIALRLKYDNLGNVSPVVIVFVLSILSFHQA